jgi:hypothetical protein
LEHIVVLFGQDADPLDIEEVMVECLEHIVVLFGQDADPLDIEEVMVECLEHIVVLFGQDADPLDIEEVVASPVLLHQFVVGMVLLLLHHHLE